MNIIPQFVYIIYNYNILVCTYICFHADVNVCVDWSGVVVMQNQRLFTCKSAEEARDLVRDNAKVDERRGDQTTPLIIQVTTQASFTTLLPLVYTSS